MNQSILLPSQTKENSPLLPSTLPLIPIKNQISTAIPMKCSFLPINPPETLISRRRSSANSSKIPPLPVLENIKLSDLPNAIDDTIVDEIIPPAKFETQTDEREFWSIKMRLPTPYPKKVSSWIEEDE